jgi:hypothetical protein
MHFIMPPAGAIESHGLPGIPLLPKILEKDETANTIKIIKS